MSTRIGAIHVDMGLNTAQFQKGVKGAQRDAQGLANSLKTSLGGISKSFGVGLLGGLTAGGITGLVGQLQGISKAVAQIGDSAKQAGLGVKAFQEWKFVAEQNRVSIDSLVDGFKELSLRADEFIVTGKGSGAEAFQRLGYSAEELREKLKDPSALLLEIIGRLGQLDKAAQIRISDELFGGTGGEKFVQLIGQGEAGIRKTIQTANDLGIVMDEKLIQKAGELDRQFNLVSQTVGTALKTAIVEAATALESFVQQFRQFDADYAKRRQAMDLGTMAGEMAGTQPGVRTTPKSGRLAQVSVPFSQLAPMDMNKQVALYAARESIAKIESGGNYKAIGPMTKTGDQAFGKYQVMGSNIAEWTKQAIGTALTPEQFLNNPAFQDKVFDHIFGGYIDQFGAQGASQAWFGGPGAVGKSMRTDQLGTSVGEYGKQFTENMKDNWAGLRDVSASYTAELEKQQQQYEQMGQIANTVFDGLVNALADGKLEGRELLQILMSVMQQLMQMKGVGGSGGILGMLLGGMGGGKIPAGIPGPWGATLHSGGTVGTSGLKRKVNPAMFAVAPRMHSGGVAGLRHDEVAAILQKGEVVIPKNMRGSRSSSNSSQTNIGSISIRVDDQGNAMNTGDQTALGRNLTAAVQQEIVRQQRPGGLLAGTARR